MMKNIPDFFLYDLGRGAVHLLHAAVHLHHEHLVHVPGRVHVIAAP